MLHYHHIVREIFLDMDSVAVLGSDGAFRAMRPCHSRWGIEHRCSGAFAIQIYSEMKPEFRNLMEPVELLQS